MHPPSCLNVMAHIDPRFGGLSTSLPAFCDAVRSSGRYDAPLASFCLDDEQEPTSNPGGRAFLRFPVGHAKWIFDRHLRERFSAAIHSSDVVHIHGVWQEHSTISALLSTKFRKPYLMSAHGMLEPWALRQRKWKKKLYSMLIESRNLSRAVCLRALTAAELADYRRFGLRNPVAVIPNGISVPARIDENLFWSKYPHLQDQRLLLFLGRLHHKKGVHLLYRAWAKVCKETPGAQLVVAGPDSENTLAELNRLATELGIGERITCTGMLHGDLKWSALRAAGVFVLPSYSEGFSIAVLEALAVGTPVIVSHACHFPEIEDQGCGWSIVPAVENLTRALRDFLETSAPQAKGIGLRGQSLVAARYTWEAVGLQTADLLDWALGGTVPSSFHLELR